MPVVLRKLITEPTVNLILIQIEQVGIQNSVKHYCVRSPTPSEGTPLTTMEAMKPETPVIAGRVGGVPEIPAGSDAGQLVIPDSIREIRGSRAVPVGPGTRREVNETSTHQSPQRVRN